MLYALLYTSLQSWSELLHLPPIYHSTESSISYSQLASNQVSLCVCNNVCMSPRTGQHWLCTTNLVKSTQHVELTSTDGCWCIEVGLREAVDQTRVSMSITFTVFRRFDPPRPPATMRWCCVVTAAVYTVLLFWHGVGSAQPTFHPQC